MDIGVYHNYKRVAEKSLFHLAITSECGLFLITTTCVTKLARQIIVPKTEAVMEMSCF